MLKNLPSKSKIFKYTSPKFVQKQLNDLTQFYNSVVTLFVEPIDNNTKKKLFNRIKVNIFYSNLQKLIIASEKSLELLVLKQCVAAMYQRNYHE